MAGTTRLVRSRAVPSRAPPPIHQFCDIILAPSIMKPKPSPRMMPSTTGRVMSLATCRAVPVRPRISQINSGCQARAPHHRRRDDERLRGLRGGDGAGSLHGLHRDRRAVDEAAHDHGQSECEQHPEGIHFEDADVGNDERDQRAQIAEGAGDLHAVEPVGNAGWDGLFGHVSTRHPGRSDRAKRDHAEPRLQQALHSAADPG